MDFWACDASALPLRKDSARITLALNLLDCVPDPLALLRSIAGSLEPGGLLLEFDPGADSIVSQDHESLRWFEIAGDDGVYHPAAAEIRGSNQIFVASPDVPTPKTVRYAFVPAAVKPNFYNSAGLPAGPFRTDVQPVQNTKK